MLTEDEILNMLYEALPEDILFGAGVYPVGDGYDEFYVTKDGECWRIRAERHYHSDDR